MKKSKFVLVLFLMLYTTSAFATQRYALVIGANKGDPTEKTLKYAERDAKRVSEVLVQLGNFKSENMVTLLGAKADAVERVLKKLSERIEREGGEGSMLLVYYSGHADANALHLQGTHFSFPKLQESINLSPASFKVLMIDACKSGDITRVKGGKPAAAFDIEASRWESGHGMAIITSSAAGEDAQESDRLQAGFFTHNLVAGLRGAADSSGDKIVTLSEVYDYVYKETLRATSSAKFLQHPTYAFDIRGRKDVTLTRISKSNSGTGYLKVIDPGKYLLFRGGKKGELVAEILIEEQTELALNPGTYFVRRRENYRLYETEIKIKRAELRIMHGDDMSVISRGEVARKGGDEDLKYQWAVVAAAGFGTHVIEEIPLMPFLALGLHLDTSLLSMETRLKIGQPITTNGLNRISHNSYGADFTTLLMWDFRPFLFGFGVRLGGALVHQSVQFANDIVDDRFGFVGGVGPILSAEIAPLESVTLGLRAGFDMLVVPRIESENPGVTFSPYGELNVSTYF